MAHESQPGRPFQTYHRGHQRGSAKLADSTYGSRNSQEHPETTGARIRRLSLAWSLPPKVVVPPL
ncbi:hypothetical protein IG631_23951 [Alternaria alternata]|nr:hypothetical protein IG631_23951 [Alternaria alternata]